MAPVAPPSHLGPTLFNLSREVRDLLLERSDVNLMVVLNAFDLVFEFTDPGSSAFSKSSLGSTILGLALCWRRVCSRLATWLRTGRNDPFLRSDGTGRAGTG
jgi:hypothetical protein